MKTLFALICALCASTTVTFAAPPTVMNPAATASSHQFIGLQIADWTRSIGAKPGEITLTSPIIAPLVNWNELVASWNAALPATAVLSLEARGLYSEALGRPVRATKFYHLGEWSSDAALHPRHSVKDQADGDGDVDTDTLVVKRQGMKLQLRLTLGDDGGHPEQLVPLVRFVGASLLDNTRQIEPREPDRAAWGRTIGVPERFQGDYKDLGGAVWCSPTSVSMILEHWSKIAARPEMNLTVPQVAAAVHDPQWPGTGNWSFNAAFAGSFPGFRAYVTRFSDVRDLETWIAAGVPVALSVNYGLLLGPGRKGGGHLVVCCGFTPSGDVVIADPGQHTEAGQHYRIFPRADVVAGWGASHNTVYLIYPETMPIPIASPNWAPMER